MIGKMPSTPMNSSNKALTGNRILCVDDHPDLLEFIHSFLVSNGAIVTACASAEEAIEILKKEHFDILISDRSMPPGLDGFDLAHTLRRMETEDPTRKATPTVMISGDALRPSRKRRFADFQVYLPKPIDTKRLIHIIERLAEAESEAVKCGSLGSWEAQKATEAAIFATDVAATATAAAAEATIAASDATIAATGATATAEAATKTATKAEKEANAASENALPLSP